MAPSLLLLAGLRASGKSTIGPLLATQLALPFVDLDHQTAALLQHASAKLSIAELFVARGEGAFRNAECDAFDRTLQDASRSRGLVLALGGGTLMQERARETLRSLRARTRVCVLLLDPPVATMRERLRQSAGDRPSLTGAGIVDEVEIVALQRTGLYRSLADRTISEHASPHATAHACLAAFSQWKENQGNENHAAS